MSNHFFEQSISICHEIIHNFPFIQSIATFSLLPTSEPLSISHYHSSFPRYRPFYTTAVIPPFWPTNRFSFSLHFDQNTAMNSHFLSAVAPYVKKGVLTHQQRVCRLYKASLKSMLSWSTDREVFLEHATVLRKRFRDNASLDPNSEYYSFSPQTNR